jgi:hypothetical protein
LVVVLNPWTVLSGFLPFDGCFTRRFTPVWKLTELAEMVRDLA